MTLSIPFEQVPTWAWVAIGFALYYILAAMFFRWAPAGQQFVKEQTLAAQDEGAPFGICFILSPIVAVFGAVFITVMIALSPILLLVWFAKGGNDAG